MDVLWRIIAALSFDCFKHSSSSRSPTKMNSNSSRNSSSSKNSSSSLYGSSSLTGSASVSVGRDLPHCQCCITYESRLKRLSCGHLYCSSCCDHIVNLAFEDIEGLSDYPCPICKSTRQLGVLEVLGVLEPSTSSGFLCGSHSTLEHHHHHHHHHQHHHHHHQRCTEEFESPWG